jgi:predicted amidophosphoribosyltransferase
MCCSSCNFENAAGKKFCIRCGGALSHRCPKCSSDSPDHASFFGDRDTAQLRHKRAHTDFLAKPTAAEIRV